MTSARLIAVLGVSLFLSLSANFFLAGVMLGNSYGNESSAWGSDRSNHDKREEVLRRLPAADREILEQAARKNHSDLDVLRGGLEAARQEVKDAMKAEPFDQDALDAALRAEKEKKMDLLRRIHDARRAAISRLSPEGRAVILKSAGPRMERRSRHDSQEDDLPFLWDDEDDFPPP